ncbi:hypothetical protein Bca4012_016313 [Brassica carinata]
MAETLKEDSITIREVWNDNLLEEFALIREIVDRFTYIAMDTEFPGVVLKPVETFKHNNDLNYRTLKENVDLLKLIQVGLTFSDEDGNLPTCGTEKFCVWQFNFREFNIGEDIYASESIELLRQCGIDFKKNVERGIDVVRFGELMMSSGIVLNDSISWVTFHGGYDFGYLVKLLTCRELPMKQADFFKLLYVYFPTVYDIKHLMTFCNGLFGGLNRLAELMGVERVGVCHQAGSDSLLTLGSFRKLKERYFTGSTERYTGVLYGLGVEDGTNRLGTYDVSVSLDEGKRGLEPLLPPFLSKMKIYNEGVNPRILKKIQKNENLVLMYSFIEHLHKMMVKEVWNLYDGQRGLEPLLPQFL